MEAPNLSPSEANDLMEVITFILGWAAKWIHSLITKRKNNDNRNKYT